MKIQVQFKHRWAPWLFAACILFIVALPFTFICMGLVSESPFWMWQLIFMFFGALFLGRK